MTIFAKFFHLRSVTEFWIYIWHASKMDTLQWLIYAKLIIAFTPNNFPIFPFWSHTSKYKIQANERLTKNFKKWSTIQFDVSDRSFIFFIPMSQAISFMNRSGACYFSHAPNKWRVCWCVRVLLHASNGEDWRLWLKSQCL